ncbi:hypothetical protein Tco_1404719 [Tanacetum coccineum]
MSDTSERSSRSLGAYGGDIDLPWFVDESLNVTFDETPPSPKTSPLEDDELVEEEDIEIHARDYVDRKSTSGVCMFMRCCLTSWFSKKQTALAISITEAEYVSAKKACQQDLWMKQAIVEYGVVRRILKSVITNGL